MSGFALWLRGLDGRALCSVLSGTWPKIVIAIGVLLSLAWIGFLAWLLVHILLAPT